MSLVWTPRLRGVIAARCTVSCALAYAARPSAPTPLQAQRARDAQCRQRAAVRARRERVAKVEVAFRAELREPTPRSPRAVLAAIGVSDFLASAHCADLYAQLRAAYASGGAERRAHIERLDAALRAEARLTTPRSPHAILRQLGEHDSFARKYCPKALLLLSEARVARRSDRIAAVETAFRAELCSASPRAPHVVLKAIGVPPWDAKRYCRELYDQLRDAYAARPRELTEYQRKAERKRAQREAAAAESVALARRVSAALRAELRRAVPRSPHAVLKTFGLAPSYAQRHCPEAYARLRDARTPGGSAHDAIVGRLDAALRAEARRSKPRSPNAICKEQSLTSWYLHRYCSDACALLREARAEAGLKSRR